MKNQTNIGNVSGKKVLGAFKDFCEKIEGGAIPWKSWQVFRNLSKREHEALAKRVNPFRFPKVPDDEVKAWKVFYRHFFGMEVQPRFPKKTEEFPWGVYIPKGLTENQVIDVSRQYYPVAIYGSESIKEARVLNLRDVGDTGIRLRARGEADEENKNKSAKDLEVEGHTGIALIEYLILHLFHWWKTGEHLDKEKFVLCTGSRLADGSVPDVYWDADELRVLRRPPSDRFPHLRSRSVVSE